MFLHIFKPRVIKTLRINHNSMTKKQIVQLVVLTFSFYLSLFFLTTGGEETYEVAFAILSLSILLGIYIIYSQKKHKLLICLRILLYIILGYYLYSILDYATWFYGYYSRNFPGVSHISILWRSLGYGFDVSYSLIISAVLLLNKQPKAETLKIGKFKISL